MKKCFELLLAEGPDRAPEGEMCTLEVLRIGLRLAPEKSSGCLLPFEDIVRITYAENTVEIETASSAWKLETPENPDVLRDDVSILRDGVNKQILEWSRDKKDPAHIQNMQCLDCPASLQAQWAIETRLIDAARKAYECGGTERAKEILADIACIPDKEIFKLFISNTPLLVSVFSMPEPGLQRVRPGFLWLRDCFYDCVLGMRNVSALDQLAIEEQVAGITGLLEETEGVGVDVHRLRIAIHALASIGPEEAKSFLQSFSVVRILAYTGTLENMDELYILYVCALYFPNGLLDFLLQNRQVVETVCWRYNRGVEENRHECVFYLEQVLTLLLVTDELHVSLFMARFMPWIFETAGAPSFFSDELRVSCRSGIRVSQSHLRLLALGLEEGGSRHVRTYAMTSGILIGLLPHFSAGSKYTRVLIGKILMKVIATPNSALKAYVAGIKLREKLGDATASSEIVPFTPAHVLIQACTTHSPNTHSHHPLKGSI